jgi:anti-sigma B factor antagonist
MTNLNITERQNGFISILDLDGKIRLGDGCRELHEALRLLVQKGEKRVLLNMANVAHIDSSGLGELVSGYTTFEKNGGEMKLLNLSDRVHELMTMTKLLTVFEVFEDEMEAITSFAVLPEKIAITKPLDIGDIKYEAIA